MAIATTALSRWLQLEMKKHNLTQLTAAAETGVGVGTISDIIRRGHIPKIDTLIRLADHFGTPPEYVLRLAADLPPESSGAGPAPDPDDDYLIQELVDEFRKIPDDWKPEALAQVQMFVRLSNLPSVRYIGEDQLSPEPEEPAREDQQDQKTQAA